MCHFLQYSLPCLGRSYVSFLQCLYLCFSIFHMGPYFRLAAVASILLAAYLTNVYILNSRSLKLMAVYRTVIAAPLVSWEETSKSKRLVSLSLSLRTLTSLHHKRSRRSLNTSYVPVKSCFLYIMEGRMQRTTLTNVWDNYTSYDADDVALVTQTSQDRIGRIQRLLEHWEGPVSLTIYVDLQKLPIFMQKVSQCPSLLTRQNIDLHLVANEGVCCVIDSISLSVITMVLTL